MTGASKGIGFEIVKQLCKKFDGKVLLAARNVDRGQAALRQLQQEGLSPEFLALDVDNLQSIESAKEEVEGKYGRLDVLINNAAVLFKHPTAGIPFAESARRTIQTNYHGVLLVTTTMIPLLQPNSRVVHISTGLGSVSHLSKHWRQQILSPDLTVEKLTSIMDQFVQDAQSPDYGSKQWPPADGEYTSYRVSKVGVIRLAQLQAQTLAKMPGILVNAVCPGWVRTDMGGASASRSVEKGAETPVYLSLLPPGTTEPNGQFLRDRKVLKWH